MDIQKFRSIREEKIKSLIEKLDKIQKNIKNETNVKKVDILQIQAKRIENQISVIQSEIKLSRSPIDKDLMERNDVYYNFPKKLENALSNNFHLKFHGTNFYNSLQIIKDGSISSSVDRNGYATSYDEAGQISVTDKNSVYISVQSYMDITSKFLPSGCLFALLPNNQKEDELSKQLLMNNVNFRSNPSQLYGIITTTENVPAISQWCKLNHLDTKIMSFDDALRQIEKDSKVIDNAISVIGDNIDLSNSIDVASIIETVSHTADKTTISTIDDVINSKTTDYIDSDIEHANEEQVL